MAMTASQPSAEMNMTPLIDVLLVMLVLFILTIPAATNSLDVNLPTSCHPRCPIPEMTPDRNVLTLDAQDRLVWNATPISPSQLTAALAATRAMPVEPELQFAPDAAASYDAAAHTVAIIKASGVTNFGFVGNERYRSF